MNNNPVKPSRTYWLTHELIVLQTKKETTAYLYIILTLFTVSIFGFFVLRPAFATITNLQKQLADSKSINDALEKKLTAIRSLDAQYAELQPDLGLVYQAIPKTAELPTLIRQIEVLARNHMLSLKSFNVEPIQYYPLEKNGNLYGYTFSLQVSGTQDNINNFLNDLTNFNRIISIQSISTGKTSDGGLQLSFSGKAYFQGE